MIIVGFSFFKYIFLSNMFYLNRLAYVVIGVLLIGCTQPSKNIRKFELLKASETGITFQNTIDDNALNVFDYVNMYNGAGVAVADFDKDGFEDLFFAGNLVSSRLYLNNGKIKPFSFLDKTVEAGVETKAWVNGVTVVDIDQNGWVDLYCSVSGGESGKNRANLLFLNRGLDANGTLRFEEQAAQYNLNDTTHTIQSAFFDFDGDDDLDVFMMVNHPTGYLDSEANRIKVIAEIGDPEHTDRLYRNDGADENGNTIFTDVSKEAGITLEGFGLGLAINDFNEDGRPDIYVANDYVTNDIIYINNGDGTFTDRVREYVNHTSFASMGVDVADINNDGRQDFMVLDMLPEKDDEVKMMYPAADHIGFNMRSRIGYLNQYNRNTLQVNNGIKDSIPRKFSEIGQFSKVFNTNWSWSVLMPDLDLDGWRDIFITNGFLKDVNDLDFVNYDGQGMFGKQKRDDKAYLESLKTQKGIHIPNYLFQNQGNLVFENTSRKWGFDTPSYSNGAAYADFDNDGDLDLAINNINESAFIYKNNTISSDTRKNNYLQIHLEGEEPNVGAIGAKISFESSQGVSSYVNYRTRGFMSSVSSIVNFGLGKDTIIDRLHITWPDGTRQSIDNIKANQRLVVKKEGNEQEDLPPNSDRSPLFKVLRIDGLDYEHQEMSFNDFDYQALIPFKLSKLGPSLAVGDMDNNQLDDIYVGGAKGAVGKIFFQERQGEFTSYELEDSKSHEDQASLVLDVDNDGDLDMYVASGGVENGQQSRYYEDRLWINTGNRTFERANLNLPRANASCVVAADYDKDGDLDIFVGGASIPESYPRAARSMLLQNNTVKADAPSFVDLGHTIQPELGDLGIVRSALWSDYDNDGWQDLLIVGEFMPLTIFKNEKGKLVRVAEDQLPSQKGIWNSINGHDLDQDGDIDYVLGNFGLNSKYKPTEQEPVKIYVDDFDQNGIIDPIMTYFSAGREVPVHLRDDIFKQLVLLKKKMPTYKKYAEATITDVISTELLKNTPTLQWNYAKSVCFMNRGEKGFEVVPMPARAQIAPIYGTLIEDFNGDGIPDILAVGNSQGIEVFSGYQDSSFGTVLIGKGEGTFEFLDYGSSGVYIDGDAKAIVNFKLSDGSKATLVSKNDDSLELFSTPFNKPVKIVDLKPFDQRAEISYRNGNTEIREFYYGSGYYSQGSRSLPVSKEMTKIKIVDSKGNFRYVPTESD